MYLSLFCRQQFTLDFIPFIVLPIMNLLKTNVYIDLKKYISSLVPR